ncbi:hypothetical protein, partial [Candidatus Venteria ishoeyi]|uniref:hypothetical protein n=1 Tax=Candidatus Venteria ishoeyi TaxID=1899563 RepID=UPI0011B05C59
MAAYIPAQSFDPDWMMLSYSGCRRGLVGVRSGENRADVYKLHKKSGEWLLKTVNLDKNSFTTGNLFWQGEAGKALGWMGPVNRHYHGGAYIQAQLYRCGKSVKPEPPAPVLGACVRLRELPESDETFACPFIAVLESGNIVFYW